MDKEDKTMPWSPDLKKETKHYSVSYHPPTGDRIKLKVSTEHKPGSSQFVHFVHAVAKKQGLKAGTVGAHQENAPEDIIETKMSDMVESGTPHGDLADEFVAGIDKKPKMKVAPLGKEFIKKCMELQKKKGNPLRVGAAPRGTVIKPTKKEKEQGLPDLLNPVLFNKPKSSIKEFLTHEDEIKAKAETSKDVAKSEDIKDKLIGIADMPDKKDVQFDPKEMAMGVAIEMEHTKDRAIAEKIAKDHLSEIGDYYTRLKVMEDNAQKEGMKKSAKSDAKKLKDEIGNHLQAKMYGHQINIMDTTSLFNHAEQLHASGKSPENAATEAFEHFKKIGKIKESNPPVAKSDPEDMWEHGPAAKSPHKPRMATWEPKHPDVFGSAHKEFKQGDRVNYTDDEGKVSAGEVRSITASKIHMSTDDGALLRVPIEKVKKIEKSLKKSEDIKKLDARDYDNAIFELKKSADDSWVSDFSKEFKTLADTYSLPFQAIAQKEGTVDCHIFKVGSCSIVHKAMGSLIDVKLHYPIDCPVEDKKLAKAMFYKLQMYYQGGLSNVERYIGSESMGIMRKAEIKKDAGARMEMIPGKGASSGKRYEGLGLADWFMENMKIQFQRKRRPLTGKNKPKSLQARRQSRYSRRLMGVEKDKKALGKSLYTTEKGENIFKAFGSIAKPKSSFAGVSVKTPTAGKPPSAPKPKSMSSKPKMTFTSKVTGKSPIAPKAAKVPKISSPKI